RNRDCQQVLQKFVYIKYNYVVYFVHIYIKYYYVFYGTGRNVRKNTLLLPFLRKKEGAFCMMELYRMNKSCVSNRAGIGAHPTFLRKETDAYTISLNLSAMHS